MSMLFIGHDAGPRVRVWLEKSPLGIWIGGFVGRQLAQNGG